MSSNLTGAWVAMTNPPWGTRKNGGLFAGYASIAPVLPSDPPVDPWHVPGFPGATRGLGKVGHFVS